MVGCWLPAHTQGATCEAIIGCHPAGERSAIPPHPYRRVKIVATLGPATSSHESIHAIIAAGVDVVRLNFSHGTHEEHATSLQIVREVATELNREVAVLQDLSGPKLRTGELKAGPVTLRDGEEFTLTTRPVPAEPGIASTSYEHLPKDVSPGATILLDDGKLELRVLEAKGTEVRCRVVKGGLLKSHKGINLPGVRISMPTFTDKDREDLEFGLAQGVDYVAMSFVRDPADIRPLRAALKQRRAQVPVLAKIEKPEALSKLDAVIRAYDGIMVARGDLGVELSPEEVPVWQKIMTQKANEAGKPVIIATQMLESMIDNPRPTRAEASDVANAALDGADAVMLSGETAVGRYPADTVEVMARILVKAEATVKAWPSAHRAQATYAHAVSRAACALARDLDIAAIVAMTRSGHTAQLVSKDRPDDRIIAFTDDPQVGRRLALWWGLVPVVAPFARDTEQAMRQIQATLLARGLVSPGDEVIIVGSTPIAARGHANFVKLHRVQDRPGR